MLLVKHAILHSFDFITSDLYMSDSELDLEEKKAKSYVQRRCRKALYDPDNNNGICAPDAPFSTKVAEYFNHQSSFLDLSKDIANFFYEELRKSDEETPHDLLVVQFSDSVDDDTMTQSEDAMDDAFEGNDVDYLAVFLLPRRQIFIHSMYGEGGRSFSQVLSSDAALPNPTAKIDSYCVLNCRDFETVVYRDKERSIAGVESLIIPDGLLCCTHGASSKEVIDVVAEVVHEIAVEKGINPTLAVSKAKAYVTESAEEEQSFDPIEVGKAVFEEAPQIAEVYEERIEQKKKTEPIPEQVALKKSQATRMTRNQKIKTDTGIEIVFPTEYAKDTEFIEFVTNPDGTLSIQVKNVTSIENK